MTTKKSVKQPKLLGAIQPRLHTPFLTGKTLGNQVAQLAKDISEPLLPWQKLVLDDMLRVRNGKFVKRSTLLIAPRQNGKSHIGKMRALAGLFLFGEKNILLMSSNRSMSITSFRGIVEIIERNDFLKDQVKAIRWTNGMEAIEMKNGGRLEIAADNRSSSRGRTVDFLWLDELREFSEEGYKAALPTTRARENAQILLTSNAGDAFSTVLNTVRERANSYPPESFGYYEWSAPEMAKISDRKAWAVANPTLGSFITEQALEEALSTSTVEEFKTESLSMWIDSLVSPFPHDWFETTLDASVKLTAGGGTTMFGFDVSPIRKNASLVAAQIQGDRIAVGILQMWHSPTAINELTIAAEIKAWADKYRPQKIFYDRYSTQTIAERLQNAGCKVEDISGQAFYQACGDLLEAINNHRLVHSGQEDLRMQMANVAAKNSDAGWRIVRRQSAGDISAPIGLAMVVSKLMKPISTPKIIAV
jgi:phage terminase large subunit-like protein